MTGASKTGAAKAGAAKEGAAGHRKGSVGERVEKRLQVRRLNTIADYGRGGCGWFHGINGLRCGGH
jgi:hypothetical protein